ncbi:SubName: Full=Uncharacterized protein {ECO:0000313/EMBL:CCA72853.1} [Serendipita indica DSM 11827]|nr:SubName: Full=Uncharacterized protein {ECO:0000313/EMBL:CCA72853.1} [Serendipita indica DSM 11827]
MLVHETTMLAHSPATRRAATKSTSQSRSGRSTPSASPSRPASPPQRVEQAFTLSTNGHSAPWLTLRVRSNASPPKAHPLYFDRDIVEGSVDLDLAENATTIHGIVVFVRGQVYSVGADQSPFLELSQTLWTSSMGHPHDPGVRHSAFSGKLSGSYSWPFSIPLPTQIVVNDNHGRPVSVPLPPTFAPKGHSTFIDYKIQVLIQRGSLRVDNTLTTSFVYLPRARAPRPSPLLESAYQNHHPILGPSLDPEGWDSRPPRVVHGMLFGARRASLECTLAVSQPTRQLAADRRHSDTYESGSQQRIYARDCVIHLHVTLESYDTQLLDFLGASAIKVALVQSTRTQLIESSSHPHTVHKLHKLQADGEHEEVAVQGSCWPSSSSGISSTTSNANQRHFDAEIIVRKDLKPSFSFPSLSLQYTIQLWFEAKGFAPLQKGPVYSEPVTIVTDRPRGPSPHSLRLPYSSQ